MIRAILTFDPMQVNRFRRGQRGAWRIVDCDTPADEPTIAVLLGGYRNVETRVLHFIEANYRMQMPVARRYPRGAIVNPLRLLKEYHLAKNNDRDRGHAGEQSQNDGIPVLRDIVAETRERP